MKAQITLWNAENQPCCFKAVSDDVRIHPELRNGESYPEWARLEFNRCPECPLDPSVKWCPAAVSIAGLLDCFIAKKMSYDEVRFEIRREGVTWNSTGPVQDVMGLLMVYRMWLSGCPRLVYNWSFYKFFSPRFSIEKVIFQYLTTRLIVSEISRKTGENPDFEQIDPGRFAMVFEQMLRRIRENGHQPGTDAVVNGLVQIHGLFLLLQQDSEILYREILDQIVSPAA